MTDKDQKLNEDDDWVTKDVDYSPEKLSKLKGDINLLLARLETAPSTLSDLSEYQKTGNVFMTKSGKLKWKQYILRLYGDQLTFTNASVRPIIIIIEFHRGLILFPSTWLSFYSCEY